MDNMSNKKRDKPEENSLCFFFYLDGVEDLCWVCFLFLCCGGCGSSEKIVCCPGWEESLMLLPLQSLPQQRQQPGGRHHSHLRRKGLRDVSPLFLLRRAVRVSLPGKKRKKKKEKEKEKEWRTKNEE